MSFERAYVNCNACSVLRTGNRTEQAIREARNDAMSALEVVQDAYRLGVAVRDSYRLVTAIISPTKQILDESALLAELESSNTLAQEALQACLKCDGSQATIAEKVKEKINV